MPIPTLPELILIVFSLLIVVGCTRTYRMGDALGRWLGKLPRE